MPLFDEALLQQRLAAITGDLPSDSPTFWSGVTRQVKQAEAVSAKFADTIKFLKGNYRAAAQNPAPAITAGFAAYKQFVHEICPTMVRLPHVSGPRFILIYFSFQYFDCFGYEIK